MRHACLTMLETIPECEVFPDYDRNKANGLDAPTAKRVTMITAAQCRSARALLGWSLAKLAAAASVTESSIDDFELERGAPDGPTVKAIEHAFAEVGVAFSPDGDIRPLSPGEASG